VSASLLATLLAASTALSLEGPPPPPTDPALPAIEDEADEPAPAPGKDDGEAPSQDGEVPSQDGEAPSQDGEAPSQDGEAPSQDGDTADFPRDARGDRVLPYGEADESSGVEYADQTPPAPRLPYADDTPPDEALPYDQTIQRRSPDEEALIRESAEAQGPGEPVFVGRQASPQRFAIEVKFGPYLPDVDSRWSGSGLGPYATIFGEQDDEGTATEQPRKGVLSVVGFEWQFVHLGGPFSVGTTIGLFRDKADALLAEPIPGTDSLRSSADATVFTVVPVTLLLGYRFELLADRFHVPLVPYARAGIAHGFWIASKGGRRTTNDAGQSSRGGSWGWQANLGLMLRLDFIERAAAFDLDRAAGINHTYIVGEWQFSHLDSFGSDTAMVVGDDTFTLGLAFEF